MPRRRVLVGCRDADDGRLLWERQSTRSLRRKPGYRVWFRIDHPPSKEGLVYLPVGGDKAAMGGVECRRWTDRLGQAATNRRATARPTRSHLDGRRVIVGFLQNSLSLFDAKTGERLLARPALQCLRRATPRGPSSTGNICSSPLHSARVSQLYRFNRDGGALTAETRLERPGNCRTTSVPVCCMTAVLYGFSISRQAPGPARHRASKGAFQMPRLYERKKSAGNPTPSGKLSVICANGKLILWSEDRDAHPGECGQRPLCGVGRERKDSQWRGVCAGRHLPCRKKTF